MTFEKQLKLAQAFQFELSGVDYLNVSVATGFVVENMDSYVAVGVITCMDGELGKRFSLIGDQVTEKALEEIKDDLRGLGYEV